MEEEQERMDELLLELELEGEGQQQQQPAKRSRTLLPRALRAANRAKCRVDDDGFSDGKNRSSPGYQENAGQAESSCSVSSGKKSPVGPGKSPRSAGKKKKAEFAPDNQDNAGPAKSSSSVARKKKSPVEPSKSPRSAGKKKEVVQKSGNSASKGKSNSSAARSSTKRKSTSPARKKTSNVDGKRKSDTHAKQKAGNLLSSAEPKSSNPTCTRWKKAICRESGTYVTSTIEKEKEVKIALVRNNSLDLVTLTDDEFRLDLTREEPFNLIGCLNGFMEHGILNPLEIEHLVYFYRCWVFHTVDKWRFYYITKKKKVKFCAQLERPHSFYLFALAILAYVATPFQNTLPLGGKGKILNESNKLPYRPLNHFVYLGAPF